MAISGVLLIFCLLELCIASVSSHFGCQVTCCRHNNVSPGVPWWVEIHPKRMED